MGSFIWWVVIGLIAGALAKWIMPGKDPGGIIVTILLGVAGAFVGGFIASALGIGGGGTLATIVTAVLGAVILLWVYRIIRSKRVS